MAAKINLTTHLLLFSIAWGVITAEDFDVRSFGNTGKRDITLALQKAFAAACNSTVPSKVVIPQGVFALGEVVLQGPCKSPIEFQVQGTVKAIREPRAFLSPT